MTKIVYLFAYIAIYTVGCEISLAGSHHTCASSLANTGASELGGAASGKTHVPIVWMMV